MSEAAPAPAAPEATPAPVAEPVTEAPATAPETPEKTFTQKELDEILEKRLAKERRKREELKQEAAVLRKLALERGEKPAEQVKQQPQEGGEPKRENFQDYESYLEAKAEWKAEQALERRLAKQAEEEKTRTAREEQQKQAAEFKKLAGKVMKDVEDFEEVMSSSEAILTNQMASSIMAAEEAGPLIAYHLAKNPDEAERIASLPEGRQAREIWALEQKLKTAPVKKPSAAPAPISPVTGKASVNDDMPSDKDDIHTWMRKERARKAKLNQ